MPGNSTNQKSTRRSFLDFLLGASGAAWFGSMLYPVIRYLKPLPRAGPSGPTRLTKEELARHEETQAQTRDMKIALDAISHAIALMNLGEIAQEPLRRRLRVARPRQS